METASPAHPSATHPPYPVQDQVGQIWSHGSGTGVERRFTGPRVSLRMIDWIWHVRGRLPLAPGQASEDAFARLEPLFQESGTRHRRHDDTLTFQKKNQAAQDKMSVFDEGTLRIERSAAGPVLRYDLMSRALLFCFLAPLLFLAIAQFTSALGKFQKPPAEAASTSGTKKPAAKEAPVALNPIDKFLGAPAPEKPKKDDPDKPGRRGKKPSPTPAYVFAGIFAALYVVGRVLEDRLIRSLFKKRLSGT